MSDVVEPARIVPLDVEAIRERIAKAQDEWSKENLPDVESRVHDILDNALKTIVAKVLGMENRWGREWEVDHCNGRSGNSIVGDAIRTAVQPKIEELVLDAVKDFTFNEQQKASIRKEYREQLMKAAFERARGKAQADAIAAYDELIGEEYREELLKEHG
jgi:hypothetical protein